MEIDKFPKDRVQWLLFAWRFALGFCIFSERIVERQEMTSEILLS